MITTRPTLLITCALPDATNTRAEREFAVRRKPPGVDVSTFLATEAAGADAILCSPANRIDAAIVGKLPPTLRVLGTFSVGYEHLDIAALHQAGIAIVNTPGVLSAATAEFTLLLLLAAARRANEGERILRAGKWAGWSPAGALGTQLSGKNLGIFGMGRIGQTLAGIARAMGMAVHYRNRTRLPPNLEQNATYHDDDESFLAASQCLALCAPGGDATRHWLNAARIARLPAGAIIANAARGSLIDDAALVAALQTGQVAAAGLDVFVAEPAVPAAYLALENVVLTPHLGSATAETRNAMGHLVLDGIEAVLAGKVPSNLVG